MAVSFLEDALEISSPWFVKDCRLDKDLGRIDLFLDFHEGAFFECPECGRERKVLDSEMREWRVPGFFQYKTLIHAPLPRVECEVCGIRTVTVPWSGKSDVLERGV